jgi:trehalose/maltose transport system substrate-binding protein
VQDKYSEEMSALLAGNLSGSMSRRDVLKRASALGLSASMISYLVRSNGTAAQDATPVPDPTAGRTIVVPQGLRTDLGGTRISAVLADPTDPNGPFLEAAIAKFGEATGITVEFIRGETSATDRLQSYRQQWAGQSGADVYQIDVIWPGVVAEHAVNLLPTLQDLASQHFEAIVANNTVDGALVGMPWFTDAGLLFYRTDLLEKYGLQPPTTWAELTTAAQTIQDGERGANPSFNGFVWQGNVYEGLTCNGLEWQVSNGGGFIVEADGTVSVNNPQAIAAFDRARGWVNTISPEGVTTFQEPDSFNIWIAGNAAFIRNWPYVWAASQAPESPIVGKVGVSPLPKGDGEGARNADTLGGWQLMVSKYSKNQEAGIEFVKYMCSPELETAFAVERSMLPTIASVYDAPEVAAASEFIPRLKDVFQGGAVARPSSVTGEQYPEISAIYYTELNQVLTGAKSGADAAAMMESQIKEALAGSDL